MSKAYDAFAKRFLGEVSWADRRDGCPLELLDELSAKERERAEGELLPRLELRDEWAIQALGCLRSQQALPLLRTYIGDAAGRQAAEIALAIWRITGDPSMAELLLSLSRRYETDDPKSSHTSHLVAVIHCLAAVGNPAAMERLGELKTSPNHRVAWHARLVGPRPPGAVMPRVRR